MMYLNRCRKRANLFDTFSSSSTVFIFLTFILHLPTFFIEVLSDLARVLSRMPRACRFGNLMESATPGAFRESTPAPLCDSVRNCQISVQEAPVTPTWKTMRRLGNMHNVSLRMLNLENLRKNNSFLLSHSGNSGHDKPGANYLLT